MFKLKNFTFKYSKPNKPFEKQNELQNYKIVVHRLLVDMPKELYYCEIIDEKATAYACLQSL